MMYKSEVAIVIAVYNGGKTIEMAIKSALNQTGINKRIYVLDSKSTDYTQEIVNKYISELMYFREKDSGLYDAWNKAINLVEEKYIFYLNSDDYFVSNNSLELLLTPLKTNSSLQAVHGETLMKHPGGFDVTAGAEANLKSFLFGMKFITPATLFKVSALKDIKGFDLSYNISADYDMAIKLFKNNSTDKFLFIDKPIVNFSIDGMSNSRFHEAYNEIFTIIRKNYSAIDVFYHAMWQISLRMKRLTVNIFGGTKVWKVAMRARNTLLKH